MHGPKLKEAYDETLRKFDTLVQMGVTDASAKHALINRELDRMTSVKAKANTEQIRRWQTQRAAKDAPHISAATGVEFDVPEAGGGGFIAAVPADVASQPWFHGALERHHVDSFFTSGACPLGTFLVRSSTTQPGEFVLSALFNGQSYHYRIKQVRRTLGELINCSTSHGPSFFPQRKSSGGAATQWSLNETEVFESISDLVDYYRHPNKSLAGVLTTPLTRSSAVRL